MMPPYFQVEVLHNDRVNQFMGEANHLRLNREAQAERRQSKPARADGPHNPGGLQAVLAAMTRLWGATSS
jgi:hypothetical protein